MAGMSPGLLAMTSVISIEELGIGSNVYLYLKSKSIRKSKSLHKDIDNVFIAPNDMKYQILDMFT